MWIPDTSDDDTVSAPRARRQEPRARERDLATGREGIPAAGGRHRTVPRPVVNELAAAGGAASGSRQAARMADATYAYEHDRYEDARRLVKTLAADAPGSPAVRELYGLVLYRIGRWREAARELEAFRSLSGSFDQHPTLADCYRALRRYGEADEIWEELRQASPSADLVAEGRIVAAGCLADQGDLTGAIRILARAERSVGHPSDRHLRQWYVLADLHERAGDLPRARDLFSRIAAADPDAYDVRARLHALR